MTSPESPAQRDVDRYIYVRDVLSSEASDGVEESFLIECLSDSYENVRAEVLDFVIHNEVTEFVRKEVAAKVPAETSFQCLCRYMLISYLWSDSSMRRLIVFSALPDDIEEISCWMFVGKFISRRREADLLSAVSLSLSEDPHVRELATNLLTDLACMPDELVVLQQSLESTYSLAKELDSNGP
jgi:hypothetical protein